MSKPKSAVVQGESWLPLTYKIIGLAMEVHNELGPGHRETTYHDARLPGGIVFQLWPVSFGISSFAAAEECGGLSAGEVGEVIGGSG
jgi:hypothetical protein